MIDYTCKICNECERYSSCDHPCQEYSDYKLNQYLTQQAENIQRTIDRLDGKSYETENNKRNIHTISVDHLTLEKKEELMKLIEQYSGRLEDVSDMDFSNVTVEYDDRIGIDDLFDEYDVSDPMWLNVCNGKVSYHELINKSALLSYLQMKNDEYCEQNGLCNVCRNPLVEVKEDRGEHFGTDCKEKVLICEYGC